MTRALAPSTPDILDGTTQRARAAVLAAVGQVLEELTTLTVWETVPLRKGAASRWRAHLVDVDVAEFDHSRPDDLPDDDPDSGADQLAGHGASEQAALADLLRLLRRVTYARVTRSWHPSHAEPVEVTREIRWDEREGRLVLLGEQRYPVNVIRLGGGVR
ncbi:hypothetical protein [Planomonospora sp. ID82291]|uniref:hypothetical protein n=1 Tax=Planomonospora sp. ID82291 TaxID=2738136 RepID=UPI0018C40E27|nr:hypothetical protein [Planomonospora sp. ID82291]MBG0818709.1 hypothetical protein [Planomonospora sp. ID82291]